MASEWLPFSEGVVVVGNIPEEIHEIFVPQFPRAHEGVHFEIAADILEFFDAANALWSIAGSHGGPRVEHYSTRR